jgi:hypothetical protein
MFKLIKKVSKTFVDGKNSKTYIKEKLDLSPFTEDTYDKQKIKTKKIIYALCDVSESRIQSSISRTSSVPVSRCNLFDLAMYRYILLSTSNLKVAEFFYR